MNMLDVVIIYVAFMPLNFTESILDELVSLGRHIFPRNDTKLADGLPDLWHWRPSWG